MLHAVELLVTLQGMSDLRDGLLRPKPEFSPVPIWWWSGEPVTLDRLTTQLDRLLEQGVANVVVLNLAPVGPLYGSLADRPAFLSEPWWDLWEGLCEHAAEVGGRLWFYDQIGFSGANLQGQLVLRQPEFAGVELRRATDGTISTVRQGFDYLSPEPCAALLDVVHGEFERRLGRYLGSVIVGSFQDELPSLPGWSRRFTDEFEQRAGYRIRPEHPALWGGGDDPEAGQVRRDWQRVRAELAEEAFFRPLYEWHQRHGLLAGFDQQGPSRAGRPGATVRQYADYLRTHRWYSAPGSDHHGEARIHSSLAHHYGRSRTWIESFHSSGWGGTLEETFDWLVPWLLAGATLYNPHAVYYSTRGGSYEWAPPSTCWRQPYWRHYREFADTMSRLCWLLTRGRHVCDVGVLFPTTTVQAGTLADGTRTEQATRAHHRYLELVGRMVWYDARPGVLDRCHRDFDVLDDDTVAGAVVEPVPARGGAGSGREVDAGGVALRTREETYRAVVLPACPILQEATVRRLREFADAGGLLIAVGEPVDVQPELASVAVRVGSAEDVAGVLERLERVVDADGPALHREVDGEHVLVVPAARAGSATAQPMIPPGESWASGLRRDGYDFDPGRYRERCVVRVARAITDVRQADPQTGLTRPLPSHRVDTGAGVRSEIEVEFDAPLAVLTWREAPDGANRGIDPTASRAAPAVQRAPTIRPVTGAWECELIPHRPDHAIEQRRVDHRWDQESPWTSVLIGYGTFGWIRGPVEPSERARVVTDANDWRPLRYSLSAGIEKDPIWISTLGPKGMVAEEFWHVEQVDTGQYVDLTTLVPVPTVAGTDRVWLAIGTAGRPRVWWNGELVLDDSDGGYWRLVPVRPGTGRNRLWIRTYAETDGVLRGSWGLTTDPERYRRPEWLVPADGSLAGSTVRAGTRIRLDEPVVAGTVQLGTSGPGTLLVNGTRIGVQGAFDPYGRKSRVLPWDVTRALRTGQNEIMIEQRDLGTGEPPALLLDGRIELASGDVREVSTDASWWLHRDSEPVEVRQRRSQEGDPRWALLRARPHPLPEADHDGADGVLPVVPDARGAGPAVDRTAPLAASRAVSGAASDGVSGAAPRATEEFRFVVPPGAHRAYLRLRSGPPRVWVDERPVEPEPGDVGDWMVRVTGARIVRLAVDPLDGRTEGALWGGPIRFECGAGTIEPGPWDQVGLGSFSGAVRYRTTVWIERTGRVLLDLGTVRGTAEVTVNGSLAGVRIWSPYQLDITPYVQQGENQLDVLVCNTLAPWLDDASATPFVFRGQRLSGMLGPVRIEER